MKKTGLIGLGTISQYYINGLHESSLLNLVATCDLNEKAYSRALFSNIPFYKDYKEMIEKEKLDYIIISTPPNSHFEIAKYALEHNVNVLIEKPATTSLEELEYLLELTKKKKLIFHVMYHWQNGTEVIKFNDLFEKNKIQEIKTTVLDPYSTNEIAIDNNKLHLLGAWIDSGVNILSMIKKWLPFKSLEILSTSCTRCNQSNLPLSIDVNLKIDNIPIHIIIDWTKHLNIKQSSLTYDCFPLIIDHSNQTIIFKNKSYPFNDMIRLENHYYNFFKNYNEADNSDETILIHKFLFEVNNKL